MPLLAIRDYRLVFEGFEGTAHVLDGIDLALEPGETVGVVGIPQFARQARASALELREREFTHAARALGAGHARILMGTILPNSMGPLIVLGTLGVGTSILTAAGLSFVGLGVQAGTPEWGAMLHDGFVDRAQSSWPALFSGLAISLAVLGFNLFGDGLRDALDPRTK